MRSKQYFCEANCQFVPQDQTDSIARSDGISLADIIKKDHNFVRQKHQENCQFARQKMACIFQSISLYSFNN